MVGAHDFLPGNVRVFEVLPGSWLSTQTTRLGASLWPTQGTAWSHCRVTFSLSCPQHPPPPHRQVAASSPVLGVLAGWTVLTCSLGTRLGPAQVPPG